MASSLLLTSAIGFGIAHAFEPDHMAAVSTFIASRPRPREAISFGLKWATGHGLSLLILGSALFLVSRAAERSQPALFSSGVLDRFVGFVLILLGLNMLLRFALGEAMPRSFEGWKALFQGRRGPSRSLEARLVEQQIGPRFEDSPAPTNHAHHGALWSGSVLMGLLHGAAGTGAFIGGAMVAVSRNFGSALLYTLFFSVGVLAAMAIYSVLLGGVFTWGERRSVSLLRGARVITGALTCAIGVCLMLGVELPGLFDAFSH
ncbi:MAG TPA: hypothetical protein VF627_00690 [Abditibacterium sp.]